MKKLFFIAALFFAAVAADAQCINFKLAGANLGQSLPKINPDGTSLIFDYSIVIYVEKIGTGKFEKVDNSTFSIPIANFNPLTVDAVATDSADAYVAKNYPPIN